ncbi:MAG: hypothetical protein CL672_01515 [Balneola sp.]|nr:hypothetical protein [Balneola sp.]
MCERGSFGIDETDRRNPKKIVLVLHGRLIRISLSVWLDHELEKMDKIEHNNRAIHQIGWDG